MVQVNSVRGSQLLWRWFRDTRQCELLVVGEDIAATAGLAFALLGGGRMRLNSLSSMAFVDAHAHAADPGRAQEKNLTC